MDETEVANNNDKDESKIRGIKEFKNNCDPNRIVMKKSPFHELEQSLVKWLHVDTPFEENEEEDEDEHDGNL